MKNPIRRNRNIGTPKQGHGQNNKLVIPQPCGVLKSFYERLTDYKKIKRIINGHEFIFIIEQTREHARHACSINDIAAIIENIPNNDYGDLKFIVLRQPKRKEETLAPAWGRLIYSYEFEDEYFPAIVLDAVDFTRKFKWTNKLTIDGQQEIERLIADGHEIKNNGRYFVTDYKIENVRNTQLYRTLLHEFGHYVQYLELVERENLHFLQQTGKTNIVDQTEPDDKRWEGYMKIPVREKENYAHQYADKLKSELRRKKIIPFDPK